MCVLAPCGPIRSAVRSDQALSSTLAPPCRHPRVMCLVGRGLWPGGVDASVRRWRNRLRGSVQRSFVVISGGHIPGVATQQAEVRLAHKDRPLTVFPHVSDRQVRKRQILNHRQALMLIDDQAMAAIQDAVEVFLGC